ncbi:MAG: holo-ACP synthase [Gammaproteobacteria bacterium]|nr:holo-ACP synthase [Gammaproteobacteria bacterium]
MIHGIGTDIVAVSRLQHGLKRFGERFAQRLLTPGEWQTYQRQAHPARFLAKRFAAKEACAKAMGLGFRDGMSLRDIAVINDPLGRPQLQFSGRAAELRVQLGIGDAHLSLSDEQEYAIAFVTLLKSGCCA